MAKPFRILTLSAALVVVGVAVLVLARSPSSYAHGAHTKSRPDAAHTKSRPGAVVSGTLGITGGTLMQGPSLPCGCSLEAGTVRFTSVDGGRRTSVHTDKAGRFSVRLRAGRYRVVGGLDRPFHWPMGSCATVDGEGVTFDHRERAYYLTVKAHARHIYVECVAS